MPVRFFIEIKQEVVRMDIASLLVYGVLGLLILMALGALLTPVRWGIRLLVNACFGVVGLIIIGIFGALAGLTISINLFTVALATLLGVPGLVLVVLLHFYFKQNKGVRRGIGRLCFR